MMKRKLKLFLSLTLISFGVKSQCNPSIGAPITGSGGAGSSASPSFWSRLGNTAGNNIFGTLYNSPVFHKTDDLTRMIVGHLPAAVSLDGTGTHLNPLAGNKLTRIGISRDGSLPVDRPASLLHLGYNWLTPCLPQGGYRHWMDIGTFAMAGTDHMYVGLRQQSGSSTGAPFTILADPNDNQDAVINWGDNGTSYGPDNLCFNFTSPTNPFFPGTTPESFTNDGMELMRMTGLGNIGIGPRFWNSNQPKSNVHLNSRATEDNWLQITNQFQGGSITQYVGTIGANNGIRFGVLGSNASIQNGNAFLYNQENRHLIFSTNHLSPDTIIDTKERVRITSYGAPTTLPGSGYGPFSPITGLFPPDITRVSISHNPSTPVTRPMSLLHIGYENSAATGFFGWRPWMDVGSLTSWGEDHTYVGLKRETGTRKDAIIAWGKDFNPSSPLTTDRMRIIFTADPGSGATGAMVTNSGLEFVRYVPFQYAPGVNDPRMGLGDFNSLAGGTDPKNTLHINHPSPGFGSANALGGTGFSGLMFEDLNASSTPVTSNPGMGVLAVDSLGNVIYVPASGGGGSLVIGGYCSGTPVALTTNFEIPQAGFKYYFEGQGPVDNNAVGIGYGCSDPLAAKLDVKQQFPGGVLAPTIAGKFLNADVNIGLTTGFYQGVVGITEGPHSDASINAGGHFIGRNSQAKNFGVIAEAEPPSGASGECTGGMFGATTPNALINYGIKTGANNSSTGSYGIKTIATSTGIVQSYGIHATNPGVYTNNQWAGFFQGDVMVTGTGVIPGGAWTPSDREYKKDIKKLENISEKISRLNGYTYYFKGDTPETETFPKTEQVGLIAQELKEVFPQLVKEYKDGHYIVNYDGMIPVLLEAIKEQQKQIDELKTTVQSLAGVEGGSKKANTQSISLSDKNTIVLNQNVPNPFAESTTIDYNIPNDFKKAQIIFSTMDGRIIKVVEVTVKGAGVLNVFGDDLSSGVYTYTLVVDGKTIDTKKMVKQ